MKKLITTKSRRRPKQPTPAELERRREERDRRHAQRRTSIRRLLYTREQTGEALGGISISSVIRLEQDGCLSKVRLSLQKAPSKISRG
jgi:hypothetical protein